MALPMAQPKAMQKGRWRERQMELLTVQQTVRLMEPQTV